MQRKRQSSPGSLKFLRFGFKREKVFLVERKLAQISRQTVWEFQQFEKWECAEKFVSLLCFSLFFLICNSKEIGLLQGQTFYSFHFCARLLRRCIKFWILWASHILKKHRYNSVHFWNWHCWKRMSYHDLRYKTSRWEKDFPCEYQVHYWPKIPHISGLKVSHCCWNSNLCKDAQKSGYLFFILKYVLFDTFDLKWSFDPLWFSVSLVFTAATCWMAQRRLSHCFKLLCTPAGIALSAHRLRTLFSGASLSEKYIS